MAQFQGFCPRCGENVPADRYVGGLPICRCGWRDETPAKRADYVLERDASIGLCALALTMALVASHFFSWGSHALSIPALKIGAWTGTLSNAGYRELAQDCIDLGKLAQAERAYFELFRTRADPEGLALLASLQARQGKTQQALQNYAVYFQAGGKNPEAMVGNAKLLEAAGQIEPALKQYDAAAASAPPSMLPVTAVSGAVRLLISQRRLEEAYIRVLEFHASAENAKGYLNTERGNLEAWLGAKAVAAIQARVGRRQAEASPAAQGARGRRS